MKQNGALDMSDAIFTLSATFHDALIKTAMIDEMARVDNWQGLDECLEIKPEAIKKLARYADAALRALRRLESEAPPAMAH
jgi:hypothetical protein